jgi:hypothetical protein
VKFFLKFIVPVLAILWLAKIHPLGAVVAILLCFMRCAFKSRLFVNILGHFIYDVLKYITFFVFKLVFVAGKLACVNLKRGFK